MLIFHNLCNKIMAYNIANIFDSKKILLQAYQKEKNEYKRRVKNSGKSKRVGEKG